MAVPKHLIKQFKPVQQSRQEELGAQITEQMPGLDLHVFTLKFLAQQKLDFPHKK